MKGSARAHDTLVADCCKLLALYRVPHTRVNQKPTQRRDGTWHSPGGDPGAPDVIGVLRDGRALCLEMKTGDARPSQEQCVAMERWASCGAVVAIIRTVGQLHDLLVLAGVAPPSAR